jgi:hypothetical protein
MWISTTVLVLQSLNCQRWGDKRHKDYRSKEVDSTTRTKQLERLESKDSKTTKEDNGLVLRLEFDKDL